MIINENLKFPDHLKKKFIEFFDENKLEYHMTNISDCIKISFYNEFYNDLPPFLYNLLQNFTHNFSNYLSTISYVKKIKVTFKLFNLCVSYYIYENLHYKPKKFIFPIENFNMFYTFMENNKYIFYNSFGIPKNIKFISLIDKLNKFENKNLIIDTLSYTYEELLDLDFNDNEKKYIDEFSNIVKDIFEHIFDINIDSIVNID